MSGGAAERRSRAVSVLLRVCPALFWAIMTGPIRGFDRLYLRQNSSSVTGGNLQSGVWYERSFHLQIYGVSAGAGAAWMGKVRWEPSLVWRRLPVRAEFICLLSLLN